MNMLTIEFCIICFTILFFIFVVSSIYFAITGRCRAIKAEAKDDERYLKQSTFETQIEVLTIRIGEITSENARLNNVIREWMGAAENLRNENIKLKEELNKIKSDEAK